MNVIQKKVSQIFHHWLHLGHSLWFIWVSKIQGVVSHWLKPRRQTVETNTNFLAAVFSIYALANWVCKHAGSSLISRGKGNTMLIPMLMFYYRCTYTTNNHYRGYQGRTLKKFKVIHRACLNLLPSYSFISSLPLIFVSLHLFVYVLAARQKFRTNDL